MTTQLGLDLSMRAAAAVAVPLDCARFETFDEADAFTAANFGLSDLGRYCLVQSESA